MNFAVKTWESSYNIEAHVHVIGNDILVAIWGGDKAHIGAISVAEPRPSLDDPQATSATASVICMLGHKEDDVAKKISILLASRLNARVVVTAGMHWEKINDEGIDKVIENSNTIARMVLEKLKTISPFLEVAEDKGR
jgi:gallate decarboxylase subunit D